MIFFQTPKFWYKEPSFILRFFLTPISKIYSFISLRNYKRKYLYKSSKSKVIAVGGITVGGSGKTLVVQAICDIFKSVNKKSAVISRGYGRNSNSGILLVDSTHSYVEVGDEPLLLSSYISVFVGKNRAEGAKMAERYGFDFLILDDGITQRYLEPDIKIVVIDSDQKFGNGKLFPLGPNRLDFEKIKHDVDAIVILGQKFDVSYLEIPENIPVIFGQLNADFSKIKDKIVAFCGIGYPKKFFDSLGGFNLIKSFAFPDHYPFSEEDMEELQKYAGINNAQLVTTEKDWMRIPKKFQSAVVTVPVKIIWEKENKFKEFISA